MSHSSQTLSEQIEQLVREHVEATRCAAAAAVERAFASSRSAPRAAATRTRSRAAGRRRAPDELGALGERLYEAICAHPGETMTVLAPHVGVRPRELHRPMTVLRTAGRIRSAGQRHQARYFPMANGSRSR